MTFNRIFGKFLAKAMIIFQMLPSCSELVSSCLLFSLALILFPSLSSFYFILPSFSLLSMRD